MVLSCGIIRCSTITVEVRLYFSTEVVFPISGIFTTSHIRYHHGLTCHVAKEFAFKYHAGIRGITYWSI